MLASHIFRTLDTRADLSSDSFAAFASQAGAVVGSAFPVSEAVAVLCVEADLIEASFP